MHPHHLRAVMERNEAGEYVYMTAATATGYTTGSRCKRDRMHAEWRSGTDGREGSRIVGCPDECHKARDFARGIFQPNGHV